jgi:hypothetical protein
VLTSIPARLAKMLPALLIPPANVIVFSTTITLEPAEILPRLPTWIPPEITPPLTRMPSSVARIVPLSTIAPWMVLSLRTLMPFAVPEMRLVLRNPPVRNVLLVMTTPPPGPIVPALVTLPLKTVALIFMVSV